MDSRSFEQAINQLIARHQVAHLTCGRVGAELGISEQQAERGLDELVTRGILELDSDDDGNLFYFVPGRSAGGVFSGNPDSQIDDGAMPLPSERSGQWARPQATGGPQYGGPQYGGPQYGGAQYGGPPQPGAHGAPSYGPPRGPWPGQNAAPGAPGPGHPPHQGAPYPQQPGYPPQGFGPYGAAPPPGYQPPGYQQPGYQQPPHAAGQPQPPYYGQNGPVPPQQSMVPYRRGYQQPQRWHGNAGGGPTRRNATMALLLSVIPGAGQLYNNEVGKALVFFFLTSMFYSVAGSFGMLLGMLPHAWSAIDAHTTARRINAGMLPP